MTALMTIEITGIDAFLRRLHEFDRSMKAHIRRRFDAAADQTERKGKQLAPRDPDDGGALEASVRREPVRMRGGNVYVRVVAGGEPLRLTMGRRRVNIYAIVQHNNTRLKHTKGRAGYLSTPAIEAGRTLVMRLREDAAREALRASRR